MKAKSKAEKRLADNVAVGKQAVIPKSWKRAERTVRGEFLAAMMLGEARDGDDECVTVHKRGLHLKDAVIDGLVNLAGIHAPLLPALHLTDCDMPDGLNFSQSRIARLAIEGGTAGEVRGTQAHVAGIFVMRHGKFSALILDGTRIDKTVFLDTRSCMDAKAQTRFSGPVRLLSTIIGGNVMGFGGRFDKSVDLTRVKVTGGVFLGTNDLRAPFAVGGEVILQDATIGGSFNGFGGRFAQGIDAQEARIAGSVVLRSIPGRTFVAQGPVDFLGATIGGSFEGQGGRFDKGITLGRAKVIGAVLLRTDEPSVPFIAGGEVILQYATIGGPVEGDGGRFESGINAHQAEIGGAVLLRSKPGRPFVARGPVNFAAARIKGDIQGEGGWFSGLLCLMSTIVGGDVVVSGGRFDKGIDLTRAKVTGGVFLRTNDPKSPFVARGKVILVDARIGGSVEGDGGRFDYGINADGAKIGAAVLLRAREGRPFLAQGQVQFLGARIKNDFDGEGGWFFGGLGIIRSHIDGTVKFGVDQGIPSIVDTGFFAENATILGDLVLTGGVHSGAMKMRGAVIAGRFESKAFWGTKSEPEKRSLLRQLAHARRTDIKLFTDGLDREAAETAGLVAAAPYEYAVRLLKQKGTVALPKGLFDLTDARVGTLADHPLHGWPGPEGCLKLDGFRYDRVELVGGEASRWRCWWRQWGGEAVEDFSRRVRGSANKKGLLAPMWQRRLIWLRHQFKGLEPRRGAFYPQPYEQLARTLRAMGHGSDADQIAYEKRLYRVRCKVDGWLRWLGRWFLILVSKHGYSPGRAFFSLAIYIGLGAILASQAIDCGHFAVTAGAPVGTELFQFNPLLYAVDVATPFIEFGPEGSFTMAPDVPWWFGLGHMAYRLMGWVLVSITIFTLTGLMRRD